MLPLVPQLENAARFIVAIMLNSLWEDAILVFAVWLLLHALRQTNASTRYFSWLVTMIAAVILPIVTSIPQTTFASNLSTPAAATQPLRTTAQQSVSRNHKTTESSFRRVQTDPVAAQTVQSSQVNRFRTPARLRLQFPSWVATLLFIVWSLAALVIGGRLAIDLYSLERLKRDSLPLPVEFRDQMEKWVKAAYGNARDVRICVSDRIEVPVAVGLFDSMILLPKHLLDELSAGELDRISLHELAHLHRGDDWTNSVQRIAQTLLFFNPAVRFVGSNLDLEREVACDDWVLSLTGDVRPYATCLTRMAELTAWPHRPLAAPGVFVTRKGISIRIERLLNKHRNARVKVAYGVPAVVAGALLAFFVLASGVTPVIAYTTESAAATVATVQQRVIAVTHLRSKQFTVPTPPAVMIHPADIPIPPNVKVVRPKGWQHPTMPHPVSLPPRTVRPHIAALPRAAHGHPGLPPALRLHDRMIERTINIPAVNVDTPDIDVHVPAVNVHVPGTHVHVPAMHLTTPNLEHEIASGAVFSPGFSCTGCSFKGVDWAGKDLSGRSYVGADFEHANLQGANFSHTHLTGVDFGNANLRNANFSGADLSGCEMRGADLTGARFDGAKITGCDGVSVRSMDQSQLRVWLSQCNGCDFAHADFHGMDLRGIRASGMDFNHANFSGADLSNAEFAGADFSGANLSGARLHGTRFTGCDFSRTDLRGVDLSGASMTGSDLSEAIMR